MKKLKSLMSTLRQILNSKQLINKNYPKYDVMIPNSMKNSYNLVHNIEAPKDAQSIKINELKIQMLPDTQKLYTVPLLSHGLDEKLNGQLVIGDYGIGEIPHLLDEKQFQMISQYRSPQKDQSLQQLCKKNECKYFSSTSNISIILTQLYFLLSNFRPPNMENIFQSYPEESSNFMLSNRKPITFILKQSSSYSGQYSIQTDRGFFQQGNQVLLRIGTIAEFFLTNEKTDNYEKLIQDIYNDGKIQHYFRYSKVNDDLFLRSQIDCRSQYQNGKPFVFEIKTRANAPIRYDVENYQDYIDYEMSKKRGRYQSFEREYFDLIRGTFIKYAFQLKIGHMDGAFIAYHNTQKIYGFQYVKMRQIVYRLFGDQYNFDVCFVIISKLMTQINNYILQDLKQYCKHPFKIGVLANFANNSLIVLVQVMNEVKQYEIIATSEKIQNCEDYYLLHRKQPLKNPVFKYQFSVFNYINDILIKLPNIFYRPIDSISIKWSVEKHGRVLPMDYYNFLQHAYKIEGERTCFKYSGAWGRVSN